MLREPVNESNLAMFSHVAALIAVRGFPWTRAGTGSAGRSSSGLTPGFRTAGESARNMQRVSSLPKPDGFFDPKAPAGTPTPPEPAATGAAGGRGRR